MPQKTAPSLKTIFQALHITLVSKLPILPKIFLNLKLHRPMTLTQCQKIQVFNF